MKATLLFLGLLLVVLINFACADKKDEDDEPNYGNIIGSAKRRCTKPNHGPRTKAPLVEDEDGAQGENKVERENKDDNEDEDADNNEYDDADKDNDADEFERTEIDLPHVNKGNIFGNAKRRCTKPNHGPRTKAPLVEDEDGSQGENKVERENKADNEEEDADNNEYDDADKDNDDDEFERREIDSSHVNKELRMIGPFDWWKHFFIAFPSFQITTKIPDVDITVTDLPEVHDTVTSTGATVTNVPTKP